MVVNPSKVDMKIEDALCKYLDIKGRVYSLVFIPTRALIIIFVKRYLTVLYTTTVLLP